MKKHHMMIGVFAASVALTFNAEAGVGKDLALGKSPTQAVSTAFANGENPGQISRALKQAGVPSAVAANVVAIAPRQSSKFGGGDYDRGNSDRGNSDGDRSRGRGYDLAQAIDRYKDFHDHGRGLGKFIAFFKLLVGWHNHHPGGPSPC
jgi:hypothetical protein